MLRVWHVFGTIPPQPSPRLAQPHPPRPARQGLSRGEWPPAVSLESLSAMAGMMGQFIILTRRQIKPSGTPKRSFDPHQPNVRFAPIADIQPTFGCTQPALLSLATWGQPNEALPMGRGNCCVKLPRRATAIPPYQRH